METTKKNPCCPELPPGKQCDYLDLVYRLTHHTDVKMDERQQVAVEVSIHLRMERCTGPLQLGNIVYSTTLLPGEKVRLFTSDRRSRFSFDSETKLSYRHEQTAEEQYYLKSVEQFMSYLDNSEFQQSEATSSGSASSSASTSGLFGTIFNGPSASISGSFNAASTHEFIRELRINAEASHNKAVQMTRESTAVQIGEVQTKRHAEGESESHVESSSRTFSNPNRCHSVSYLFYQIDKQQTVKVSIKAIKMRVIDPAADSSAVSKPILADPKLTVIPTSVLATDEKTINKASEINRIHKANVSAFPARLFSATAVNARPLNDQTRAKALKIVQEDMMAKKILSKDGSPSKELISEFNFEFHTTLPTPGIVVKGCLDDCNTCEPAQQKLVALELAHQELQNKLLAKQIELLEKSQEYRCCPKNEEATPEEPVE